MGCKISQYLYVSLCIAVCVSLCESVYTRVLVHLVYLFFIKMIPRCWRSRAISWTSFSNLETRESKCLVPVWESTASSCRRSQFLAKDREGSHVHTWETGWPRVSQPRVAFLLYGDFHWLGETHPFGHARLLHLIKWINIDWFYDNLIYKHPRQHTQDHV